MSYLLQQSRYCSSELCVQFGTCSPLDAVKDVGAPKSIPISERKTSTVKRKLSDHINFQKKPKEKLESPPNTNIIRFGNIPDSYDQVGYISFISSVSSVSVPVRCQVMLWFLSLGALRLCHWETDKSGRPII